MTSSGFRPSELMRLAREIEQVAASLHANSLALSRPDFYDREKTEEKLFSLIGDFFSLKNQIEAIALDHHASFDPRLKLVIKKFLAMFKGYNPITVSSFPNQVFIDIENLETGEVFSSDLIFLSTKLLEYSFGIQRALSSILDDELSSEPRKQPPEISVAWWAKAPTELIPFLKQADELAMLPHAFKEERPKCGWDESRKALNKFLAEHAPSKPFKFSVRGNYLRVIPKTFTDE